MFKDEDQELLGVLAQYAGQSEEEDYDPCEHLEICYGLLCCGSHMQHNSAACGRASAERTLKCGKCRDNNNNLHQVFNLCKCEVWKYRFKILNFITKRNVKNARMSANSVFTIHGQVSMRKNWINCFFIEGWKGWKDLRKWNIVEWKLIRSFTFLSDPVWILVKLGKTINYITTLPDDNDYACDYLKSSPTDRRRSADTSSPWRSG